MQRRKLKLGLALLIVCVFLSANSVQATGTGRIYEFREKFRDQLDQGLVTPVYPQYVAGVVYGDLLQQPSPNQFYSWAKDNEQWTADFLEMLRASGEEVNEIEQLLGNKVLFVLIDFNTDMVYAATFNLETGEVLAEYEDTKTEIWADLAFVQNLLMFVDSHTEVESIDYIVNEHYYQDLGIWVKQGPFDLMMTREMLYDLLLFGVIMIPVGFGAHRIMKKGK